MAKNILSYKIRKNKEEMADLKKLLEIDASYRATMRLSPEDRAKQEIRYRVSCGLDDDQKNRLATFYDKLLGQITEWFSNNNFVACPLHTWTWVLKELNVNLAHLRPAMCYKLVALNDGATYRWHNKKVEWQGFNREQAKIRLAYLEKTNQNLLTRKKVESRGEGADLTSIFDGKL